MQHMVNAVRERGVHDEVRITHRRAVLQEIQVHDLIPLLPQRGMMCQVDFNNIGTVPGVAMCRSTGIKQVAATGRRFKDAQVVSVVEQRPRTAGKVVGGGVELQCVGHVWILRFGEPFRTLADKRKEASPHERKVRPCYTLCRAVP